MFELLWQSLLLPLAVALALGYAGRHTPAWSLAAPVAFLASWYAIEGSAPFVGGLGIIDAVPLAVLGFAALSLVANPRIARGVATVSAAVLLALIAGKFISQIDAVGWAVTALALALPIVAARRPSSQGVAWERLLWLAPIFIVALAMLTDSSIRLFQLASAAGFAVAGVVLVQLNTARFQPLAVAVVVWAVLWSALHWVQLDWRVVALSLTPLVALLWSNARSLMVFAVGAATGVIALGLSIWLVFPSSTGGY